MGDEKKTRDDKEKHEMAAKIANYEKDSKKILQNNWEKIKSEYQTQLTEYNKEYFYS